MLDPLKKSAQPALDPEVVDQMLENIFEECKKEPHTVPIEVLTSYHNYRKERYATQKLILLVVLILFFMLPLLFISPNFTVTKSETASAGRPVYNILVDTFLPISRVTASIDNQNVAVYETGNCAYAIDPAINGEMTITVTLANHQYQTQTVLVEGVDRNPPELVSNYYEDGYIFLYFTDDESGVDFENIYATGLDGKTYKPDSYDADTGCVKYKYPDQPLNLYIPDFDGNKLQLALSTK